MEIPSPALKVPSKSYPGRQDPERVWRRESKLWQRNAGRVLLQLCPEALHARAAGGELAGWAHEKVGGRFGRVRLGVRAC